MTPQQFLRDIILSELQAVRIAAKRAKNSEFRAVAVERESQLEKELAKLDTPTTTKHEPAHA